MRSLLLTLTVLVFLSAVGCGGGVDRSKIPMTEEEKRKVAAEDKRIDDEESQGSRGKKKR